jgi:hypothetical protein
MILLMIGIVAAVLCVGLLTAASIFIRLDEATCVECGSQLPVIHPVNSLNCLTGHWACPRCGTQFNSHGKVVARLSS